MTPLEVVIVSGAFTLVGSLVAWWLARRDKREARKHDDRTPTPPTTQEVWQRLDRMERLVRALAYTLGEVAEQWDEHHPPVVSKKHYMLLSEAGMWPDEWEPPLHS